MSKPLLNTKQRDVLIRREEKKETFVSIARHWSITPCRVQQIYAKACRLRDESLRRRVKIINDRSSS